MRLYKILFFLFLLTFFSCSKKPDYVLSQNKMVNVLTDLHFADAAGTTMYSENLDSANVYGWVFTKNKITSAEFDSSLAYYSRNSKKFIKIYDRVLTNLSKKEAQINEIQEKNNISIIWEDKNVYRLPFDGATNKIPLNIPINKPGKYTINVKIKILGSDQSVNPHLTAYFWYNNGSPEGEKVFFDRIDYKKTLKVTTYSVSSSITDKKFTHIKGFVFDDENTDSKYIKYAEIYSISVTFEKE